MDETSLIRKEKSQKKLDDKASTEIKVKKKGRLAQSTVNPLDKTLVKF